ncbi:MAG: PqqD family protein [Bacteroidales bacterium]|nr:PqqD family protein [Candidatus Cacconaster merdequi]
MKLKDNYTIREIAGTAVMMPSSVAGKEDVSTASLNSSGLWLLHALEGREFTFEDAVALMCEEYDIDSDMASRDVSNLLGALKECGFIDE